jgi:hypothetical protein
MENALSPIVDVTFTNAAPRAENINRTWIEDCLQWGSVEGVADSQSALLARRAMRASKLEPTFGWSKANVNRSSFTDYIDGGLCPR